MCFFLSFSLDVVRSCTLRYLCPCFVRYVFLGFVMNVAHLSVNCLIGLIVLFLYISLSFARSQSQGGEA